MPATRRRRRSSATCTSGSSPTSVQSVPPPDSARPTSASNPHIVQLAPALAAPVAHRAKRIVDQLSSAPPQQPYTIDNRTGGNAGRPATGEMRLIETGAWRLHGNRRGRTTNATRPALKSATRLIRSGRECDAECMARRQRATGPGGPNAAHHSDSIARAVAGRPSPRRSRPNAARHASVRTLGRSTLLQRRNA
jgi:hypothetical protein